MLTGLLSSFWLYQPRKLVLPYTYEFNRGHSALNGPVIANSLLAKQKREQVFEFQMLVASVELGLYDNSLVHFVLNLTKD